MSQLNQYLISLDKYNVVKSIGEGSYFVVYLVEDKDTKEKYVAKIGRFDDESSREKCLRSIKFMGQNRHPTLASFVGYSPVDFEGKEKLTILFDYEGDQNLQSLIKKCERAVHTITSTQRQIILVGICRALMFLHSRKIIHRDLKPENVIIDDQLKPHVTGLTLAEEYKEGISYEVAAGTPIYMAPEVIDGEGEYNMSVDVYSFAILMYQLIYLTSKVYDDNISAFKLLHEVTKGLRPQFKSQIKPSIKDMIEHCWSEKPSDRLTFEQLFQKLAYDPEYYIDNDVDGDEVRNYADSIKQ